MSGIYAIQDCVWPCPLCDGTGEAYPEECPLCFGHGIVIPSCVDVEEDED